MFTLKTPTDTNILNLIKARKLEFKEYYEKEDGKDKQTCLYTATGIPVGMEATYQASNYLFVAIKFHGEYVSIANSVNGEIIALGSMLNTNFDRIVYIGTKITSSMVSRLQTYVIREKKVSTFREFISVKHILIELHKHKLQPQIVTCLGDREILLLNKEKNSHHLDRLNRYPRILTSDPLVTYLGINVGCLVRFVYVENNHLATTHYRVVSYESQPEEEQEVVEQEAE